MAARAPKVQKVMVQPIVSFKFSPKIQLARVLLNVKFSLAELDFQIPSNPIQSGYLAV